MWKHIVLILAIIASNVINWYDLDHTKEDQEAVKILNKRAESEVGL